MGDKAQAKRLVHAAGVPVLPGYDDADQGEAVLLAAAAGVGYPLMIKAAAGGGGRGMRRVEAESGFAAALSQARSEAEHAFGDGRVLLERALEGVRHVEVQVFGDEHGNCVHLGERDCSVQRRHQKLIEESPSPAVDEALRERLGQAAITAARSVGYVGAGTVEFLLERGRRVLVHGDEHPAAGRASGYGDAHRARPGGMAAAGSGGRAVAAAPGARFCFQGHAIEARLCAEDPARAFLPQSGKLLLWSPPGEHSSGEGTVRIDHALESGSVVSPFYDSLLAKVIAHGRSRDEARERLAAALDATVALGVPTNKAFLSAVLRDAEFAAGGATTDFVVRRFPVIRSPGAAARSLRDGRRARGGGPRTCGRLWRVDLVEQRPGARDVHPARMRRGRRGRRDELRRRPLSRRGA